MSNIISCHRVCRPHFVECTELEREEATCYPTTLTFGTLQYRMQPVRVGRRTDEKRTSWREAPVSQLTRRRQETQ